MSAWQELDDGVLVRRYAELDQNIGLVLGDGGLLVVDSRSHPHHARVLAEHVREVSRLPVRWLVNTHWHWDHCFGNSVFTDAVVVGHRACRAALLTEGAERLARLRRSDALPADERHHLDEVEIVPPTVTFERSTSLWLGDREVHVSWYGRGHTDADVVVRTGDVSFAGDLVEQGAPPSFTDAFPRAWVETVRRMAGDLAPVVVPGHGAVVDPDFALAQAADIVDALDGGRPFPDDTMATLLTRARAEGRLAP
ncbi:MBL fold metallo-hydrolase [Aquipuribacter sp. SD81]|uniref:MBL fold metallo-hydrolase n=1 Tax=Aquipuribacter sp. SD81 TaxID=3127703 RepID=UPI00301666A8